MALTLTFADVDVYEARCSYWAGRILSRITGDESLYMTERDQKPWDIDIVCDVDGQPQGVRFRNGVLWTFCYIPPRLREVQWPLFLADCTDGKKIRIRVERIFSDSFHMDLVSENAVMLDLLVWHHAPKPASTL